MPHTAAQVCLNGARVNSGSKVNVVCYFAETKERPSKAGTFKPWWNIAFRKWCNQVCGAWSGELLISAFARTSALHIPWCHFLSSHMFESWVKKISHRQILNHSKEPIITNPLKKKSSSMNIFLEQLTNFSCHQFRKKTSSRLPPTLTSLHKHMKWSQFLQFIDKQAQDRHNRYLS